MLLAIDTATRLLSIALHDGERILAESTWHSKNHHTVELAPAVQTLFEQADVTPADLTALAVTSGPGSYTGLRIGMSFAKGLALAQSIPLVGIPTLDVIAAGQPQSTDWLCVIIQAGRKRITPGYFQQRDDRWVQHGELTTTTWDDFLASIKAPLQIAGEIDETGYQKLAEFASISDYVILSGSAFDLRRAGFLAQLAYEKIRSGEVETTTASLSPTYLT